MKRTGGVLLAIGFVVLVLSASVSVAEVYRTPDQRSLKIIPDTDPIPYLSALDRLAVGDTQGAIKRAERATETFPYHLPSVMLRHRLISNYVGLDTAYVWIRNHLQRTQDVRIFNELLGGTGPVSPRVEDFVRWGVNQGLTTRESLLFLARRELAASGYERFVPALNAGIDSYPKDVDFRYLQARVMARKGRCERALEIVRDLLRRTEGRAELYLLMARLLRGEKPEEAQFVYGRYSGLVGTGDPGPEPLQKRVYSCESR